MKFKFNPLTWEFNLVPDSGTLKQKLNWLTGNFNLTKDAGKYKQIYNVIEGEFNLRPAVTQVIVHWVWSIQLTNAVENWLLSLKAYGWTEQRNLPAEYTQLEYIVFDSTQVIDTGFTPDNNSRIESKCYRTGYDCWFYGAGPANPRITMYHSRTGTSRWGNQSTSSMGLVADTEYTFIEDKNGLTINGTLYPWASGTAGDFTCDRSLTIGNNNGSTGTRYFAGNFYYMKMYDDGVLVRDFVPCKNSSNVVGLYDLVNGVFYTATGLVAGTMAVPTPGTPMDIVCNNWALKVRHQSWLPTWYTQVEYLRSSGTQYIDLGYKWNWNTKVDIKFKYHTATATSGSGRVFGSRDAAAVNAFSIGSASWTASTNSTIAFFFGNQSYLVTEKRLVLDERLNVVFDKTTHNINWVDYGDPYNDETFETPQNLKLFGFDNNNTTGIGYVDVAYCKLWNNWVLVRDLIPCKNSSNVFGMYDLVSWQFLTNDWTDNFTAGNTVSDPVEVYTDWTTETIWVQGKNLFNKDGTLTNGYINSSGAIVSSSSIKVSPFIEIKPNTTYTISGTGNVQALSFDRYAYTYTAEQTPIAQVPSQSGGASATFTTASNAKYIRIQMKNDAVDTCQLELGSTATEYQPYFDGGTATAEMLLKVGTYQDEQEILSWNITRKVGIKVLNGTENWTASGAYIGSCYMPFSSRPSGAYTPIFVTHFVWKTSESAYGVGNALYNGRNLSLWLSSETTAATLKQWLADQYNAWTPVIVVYPLATPTTESVTGQTMNIPEWSSTIEITQASIDNLELEAVYEQEA